MNGDGKPELLCHTSDKVKDPKNNKGRHGGQFGFAVIDWSNPFGKAKFHAITEKSKENDQKIFKYTHGYGAGDVNGDGRMDILEANGWYEQPKDLSAPGPWKFHKAAFGVGGAQMHVFDVNQDGRNDVITSIKAHSYGLSCSSRTPTPPSRSTSSSVRPRRRTPTARASARSTPSNSRT
jgi:hypothetical protein